MFRSTTDICAGLFRTQLFSPQDIENVKKVQAGYKAQPLSAFLNQATRALIATIGPLSKLGIAANPCISIPSYLPAIMVTSVIKTEPATMEPIWPDTLALIACISTKL